MELTSIDYVRLISWLSYYKHRTILNKTQMQKILFICYGLYLQNHKNPLFTDDTPKAWPFGPVFPRSYKRYAEDIPADLTQEDKRNFSDDDETLKMIVQVVDIFHSYTANVLSEWSHQKGSPWYKTIFENGDGKVAWNKVINDDTIKEYFQSESWKRGL